MYTNLMRSLLCILTVLQAAPLSAQVVGEVRYKISAGDLASADAIVDEFCRTSGPNAECANAVGWLARGAFLTGDNQKARFYLERTRKMTADLVQKIRPEDDYDLGIAIGAVIEVDAKLLAAQGSTDKAVALLQAELNHWNLWDIQARVQKT